MTLNDRTSKTLPIPSLSCVGSESWYTLPDLTDNEQKLTPDAFFSVTNLLLTNPNLNSTHLFRADILYDSSGKLKTLEEKEAECGVEDRLKSEHGNNPYSPVTQAVPARHIPGYELRRIVIRRLIPRKPQLDRAINQTCHFYEGQDGVRLQERPAHATNGVMSILDDHHDTKDESHLVVYTPHVSSQNEVPWYHPTLRSLAFLYEFSTSSSQISHAPTAIPLCQGTLSLHFLPFESEPHDPLPDRLQRTLQSLLSTYLRLARGTFDSITQPRTISAPSKPPKDTLIPQHIVQNTYTRLKTTYAADLIEKWVEKTEPSKHVFEDLSIAAFLIELWRMMYGIKPLVERTSEDKINFPGFVDVACGNGVLVYVLLSEGYTGWGFDARQRKTWSIFPREVRETLKQYICIPKPFMDVLESANLPSNGAEVHDGIFERGTFIVSNHADELTPWTPILASLSYAEDPLPFLVIPCCSHALSGALHRYPPPTATISADSATATNVDTEGLEDEQPSSGDLRALRAARTKPVSGGSKSGHSSTYASLTAHVVKLAEDIGYVVETTMMRIPSTRNVGLVGRRLRPGNAQSPKGIDEHLNLLSVVENECNKTLGGVAGAAELWLERAMGLQHGQGRGKLKGGSGH